MTLGSLFDGMGGFPLSAVKHGINPVWASEIEAFPSAVTRLHFPNMKHLGDITKINGAKIEPVDIITFGSPCQDLSVAGKSKGLDGKRSGLFFHAIRIIEEMRKETKDEYPRFCVWENVPGAFSSNKGKDFREVIQSFADLTGSNVSVPMPRGNKWQSSGLCVGNGASFGWRTVDAQYWGVPQRRRRIFLVADLRSECVGRKLFIDKSLQRDPPQSKGTREKTPTSIGTSTHSAGFKGKASSKAGSVGYQKEVAPTLTAGQESHVLELYENHGQDSRYTGPLKVAPTAASKYGTGGNNTPLVLNTTYSIAGTIIGREPQHGGNGLGVQEDISYTLTGADRHGVYQKVVGALCHGDEKGINNQYVSQDKCIVDNSAVRRMTALECERAQGFPDNWTEYGTDEKGNKIKISDSQRYKMCGNSVAIPCVDYFMGNIAGALQCEEGLNDESNKKRI